MDTKDNVQGKKASMQWTTSMDEILIDALLDQVIKGNRVNGQFTTYAFNEVIKEVRTKTKNDAIDKDKIRNRMKTLKKIFAEVYDAFKGFSGFGWNPVTKLFEAHDEVWNELIQSNPKANQWRSKPVHNYAKLKDLWADDRASGDSALTPRQKLEMMSRGKQEGTSIQNIDRMVETNEAFIEIFDPESQFPSTQPQATWDETTNLQIPSAPTENRFANSSKTKVGVSGKKRKIDDSLTTKMESALQNVIKAMDRASSVIEKCRPRVYTGEEIYEELEKMEIDDALKLDACEWLTENQNKFRMLIGIPAHLRLNWLLRKFSD